MPSDHLMERVKLLREDLAGERRYVDQLKESGLTASVIIPILEDHLGYDSLRDLHFEFSPSDATNVHFDILAQTGPTSNCIFEIKPLEALATQATQKQARAQVAKYLEAKDDFYFGLLTCFRHWLVFIARYYIEQVGNEGRRIETISDKVPCCFTFDIDDEHFWDFLTIFSRDSFKQNLTQLAKGIANVALKKRGGIAWGNIFSPLDIQRQKECGDIVKQYVQEGFHVERGEFWPQLSSGEISPGCKMRFDDGVISFEAAIRDDGCLEVDLESVRQVASFLEVANKYPNFMKVMNDWTAKDSRVYTNTSSIHKDLLDQKSVWEKTYRPHWTRT